ncbi:MAG: alpha-amylase family protein [Gemmatimonadaceae bacterium]|nr:alpha-amylase family protein [Gemmatimonadaceae bacterium]
MTAACVVSACGGDAIDLTQPPIDNTPIARPTLPAAYRTSGRADAGDAFVHLFEWKWTDIASECTQVLGPAGVAAVQVSPPQEHLVLATAPWWQRYQPVSYAIERSRSGTRAEFVAMIDACQRAGVGIYVDAVINHMTAGAGTGSNGTAYTKYVYPGLYAAADFRPSCGILSYQSALQVQDCELVGLADLRTDSPSVQEKIADYLIALHRLGVAGFRIDAAKHIQPVELDAILARVNRAATTEGRTVPYVFAEVIDYGGEAVRVGDYLGLGYASGGVGDITEFKYRGIGNKFLNTNGEKVADLARFSPTAWSVLPSDKAVVFVENHDTQRSDGISYREPELLRLAYVWLLGFPYGYPSVMSSYAFDRNSEAGRDRGPPSDAGGNTTPVACVSRMEQATLGTWVCEHRDAVVLRMIAFRKVMSGADANRLWDNGGNAVAFSRGDRGFVVINREATTLSALIPTALPAGRYCDGLTGVRSGALCTGLEVVVDAQGRAQVELPARRALVLNRATRQ